MFVTETLHRQVCDPYHSIMKPAAVAAAMQKASQQLRRSIILCQMLVTTIIVYGFIYLKKKKRLTISAARMKIYCQITNIIFFFRHAAVTQALL